MTEESRKKATKRIARELYRVQKQLKNTVDTIPLDRLSAHSLFSCFTADIIKEDVVFTR